MFQIPDNWTWLKLGDIADVIGGVSYNPSDITSDGVRILRGGNIQNGVILQKEDDVFLPVSYKDEDNQVRKYDTIIVSSTGSVDALAKAATCFEDLPSTQIGAFLRIIRPKQEKYAMLVSAWCTSQNFRNYIISYAKGTSINNIRTDYLNNFEIPVPEDRELRNFSHFYNSLESNIIIERKINNNLVEIARQLYDYWFVQFDFPNCEGKPYKSSGGEMVYDARLKRDIPKNWHCGNLYEIAKFTNGIACQKFRPEPGQKKLPVIKIKEMHEGLTKDTEFVTIDIPEGVKVYNGDVLFSWSASLEVMLWCYGEGGLNQHIFKVTSANGYPKSFYYFQLLDYVKFFKRMAEARKTTMGHITQDHLEQSTIAIPNDPSITQKFEVEVEHIFDLIVANQSKISTLVRQRDRLLPILINGQVCFCD